MWREVCLASGRCETLGYEDVEPEDGHCFCDGCGDCLICYHEDGLCYDGSLPSWVRYTGDPSERETLIQERPYSFWGSAE